jgi:type I restriction enzyme, S subunit
MLEEWNPQGWEKVKIKNISLDFGRGKSKHRPRNDPILYGGKYPFVQTGDVKGSFGRITKYSQTYNEKGLSQSKLWPTETMCITIAANIAETSILTFPACFPDSIIGFVADIKKSNIYFVEYLFRYIKYYIQSEYVGTGTAQDNINLGTFEELEFPIPCLSVQNKIADILKPFDDLIFNIKKQNKTLEQIIQTIFKSWFVDFNGITEFEDSELGKIPKGWEVSSLDSIGKIITGKTPPTEEKDNFGNEYPFITIPDMHGFVWAVKTERHISEKGKESIKKYLLPENTICVSCIATPGLVTLTTQKSFSNQQINSIICDQNISPFFIFSSMKTKKQQIIQMGSGGTATLNLNKTNFSLINFLKPPSNLIKNYHENVSPIFYTIRKNYEKINNIIKIRDALLRKIMSGEISV